MLAERIPARGLSYPRTLEVLEAVQATVIADLLSDGEASL
jgi:hypothetical protein